MISKASAKFVRISPRKVRYVIDLIRKKSVPQAHGILNGSPRRASDILRKLLNQAVDAAEKNSKVTARDLMITKVTADGGPSMKRFRAASMGRGMVILKRTSHIHLELDLQKKNVESALPKSTKRNASVKVTPEAPSAKKSSTKKVSKKLVGAK